MSRSKTCPTSAAPTGGHIDGRNVCYAPVTDAAWGCRLRRVVVSALAPATADDVSGAPGDRLGSVVQWAEWWSQGRAHYERQAGRETLGVRVRVKADPGAHGTAVRAYDFWNNVIHHDRVALGAALLGMVRPKGEEPTLWPTRPPAAGLSERGQG